MIITSKQSVLAFMQFILKPLAKHLVLIQVILHTEVRIHQRSVLKFAAVKDEHLSELPLTKTFLLLSDKKL